MREIHYTFKLVLEEEDELLEACVEDLLDYAIEGIDNLTSEWEPGNCVIYTTEVVSEK